jgi:fumarylacetoacetate (FAA) hydrolase
MKLATYKDGSRDGQLVVVSRDLSTAHYATGIAATLQQVLDDWNFLSPQLQDLYDTLNQGKARHAFPFDPKPCAWRRCRAPTSGPMARPTSTMWSWCAPRATAEVPESFYTDPLMYQGGSDDFIGPATTWCAQRSLRHRL